MRLASRRLGMFIFVACAPALGVFACLPSGCPEGSEDVDGICLAVDAGSADSGASAVDPEDVALPGASAGSGGEDGGSGDPAGGAGSTGGVDSSGGLDTDECATDNGGCDVLSTCTDHEGAPPSCGPCPEGYAGDGEQGCEPRLLGLEISRGTLRPAFAPEVRDYQIDVPLLVQTASITPVAPPAAEVTVHGQVVSSGEASDPLALNLGETTVEVRVGRGGQTSRTYTLRIIRGDLGAYLKASNTDTGDEFGASVSLSGDTLAVGVSHEASAATGMGGDEADNSAQDAGAVYVFQRSGGGWAQQAYLKASNTDERDNFGFSVSLSGDTLAVGAFGEDSAATGVGGDEADNSAQSAGAVYVFQRSGGRWAQQVYLKASNAEAGDGFGASVSLSGDTLGVGAAFEASTATGVGGDEGDNSAIGAGAVYVFQRSGDTWTQQAYLKASNTEPEGRIGDLFGQSVSLSGDTLAVGVNEEDSAATGVGGDQADNSAQSAGAVYVFQRGGGGWAQQAYLKASNTDEHDGFGASVSVSGDTLAVGAPGEASAATGINGDQADNSANQAGAVYVFQRSGGAWAQQAYLKASNAEAGDGFGRSVSLFGDTLAIGAAFEDSAATGAGGAQADNSATSAGAVYIFERSGGSWAQLSYLKASNTDGDDFFGDSVSLSGDTLAIGAQREDSAATGTGGDQGDNSATEAGAVYIY